MTKGISEVFEVLRFLRGEQTTLSSATLRFCASEITDALNKRVDVPADGNISEWIVGLGSLTSAIASIAEEEIANLDGILKLLGNTEEVRLVKREFFAGVPTIDQTEFIDRLAAKAGISTLISIPPQTSHIRAIQAAARCFEIIGTSPFTLIADARSGDRTAVVSLVKIDKLFLHDPSTRSVIVEAEGRGDRAFLRQIASALQYHPPPFGPRTGSRCMLYLFFACRTELPKHRILAEWLDPDGTVFEGDYAFEKFFERCRNEFESLTQGAMLSDNMS